MSNIEMSSLDAELWLYFENQAQIDGLAIDVYLKSVEADLDLEQSNKCIYRTYLNSGFPDVTPWTATENINPARDQMTVISIRLRNKTKDCFRQTIKWKTTFDIRINGIEQSKSCMFSTNENSEEGFSTLSINHTDDVLLPNFCRHLLIWDVLAAPGPGLHKEVSHKPWLSDRKALTPLLIGHRGMGASIHAKNPSEHPGDNTMLGFKKAFAIGADGVELDVQLSRDDTLIIRHDFCFGDGEKSHLYRDMNATQIVDMDPDMPFLSNVFREVDRGLGIDIEVKYPMRVVNGLLEKDEEELQTMDVNGQKVLRWPKNKLAELVLKAVGPEAKKRRLFLSAFHPDLTLMLSRKTCPSLRPLLPILGLTRGEMHRDVTPEKFHSDVRSRTVASAASWARAVHLDGIVPFAASVFSVKAPRELFGDDLSTVVWGGGLNSVEVLKDMQRQPWIFGLIFDKLDELLGEVKTSLS